VYCGRLYAAAKRSTALECELLHCKEALRKSLQQDCEAENAECRRQIRVERAQHMQQHREHETERQEQQRQLEKLICEVSELRLAAKRGETALERNQVLTGHEQDGHGRRGVPPCRHCDQVRAEHGQQVRSEVSELRDEMARVKRIHAQELLAMQVTRTEPCTQNTKSALGAAEQSAMCIPHASSHTMRAANCADICFDC
jgi:hypothetical protein